MKKAENFPFGPVPWTPEISRASTLTSSYTSLLLLCIVHLILHILHQMQGKIFTLLRSLPILP